MKGKKQKKHSNKGKKYEKPVSLWGMSFDEAVTRLATAKKMRGPDAKKA